MKRTLVYIPAWHNRADWGGAKGMLEYFGMRLSDGGVDRRGKLKREFERYWAAAEVYWDAVEAELEEVVKRARASDWKKTKIFSDSVFAISPKTMSAIRKMAERGSRHFGIILKLVKLGCKLEVTEDRKFFRWKLASGVDNLKDRDKVIARNINGKLTSIGFLLLGMSHKNWRNYLDKDIEVLTVYRRESRSETEKKIRSRLRATA